MNPLRLAALAVLLIGNVALADPDPIDAPLPCAFSARPCGGPHFAFGFELGGGGFVEGHPFAFGEGTGAGVSPGPTWGFRLGFEFTRWLALDGHYAGQIGLVHADYSPTGPTRLVTNGTSAELRLTAPFPYVQPYLFGGVGIYNTSVSGTYPARAGTEFHASTSPGIPMGVGIGVPVCDSISIGAEATHHYFIGESFSTNEDVEGGDLTTFNAMLRFRI